MSMRGGYLAGWLARGASRKTIRHSSVHSRSGRDQQSARFGREGTNASTRPSRSLISCISLFRRPALASLDRFDIFMVPENEMSLEQTKNKNFADLPVLRLLKSVPPTPRAKQQAHWRWLARVQVQRAVGRPSTGTRRRPRLERELMPSSTWGDRPAQTDGSPSRASESALSRMVCRPPTSRLNPLRNGYVRCPRNKIHAGTSS